MKIRKVVKVEIKPGEKVEIYTRADKAKYSTVLSGPGTISIVRYEEKPRKDKI